MNPLAHLNMTSEAMPLGDGIAVTFTMNGVRIDARFSKPIPNGRKGKRYLAPYRRARGEFLTRVSLHTGLTFGVVEA